MSATDANARGIESAERNQAAVTRDGELNAYQLLKESDLTTTPDRKVDGFPDVELYDSGKNGSSETREGELDQNNNSRVEEEADGTITENEDEERDFRPDEYVPPNERDLEHLDLKDLYEHSDKVPDDHIPDGGSDGSESTGEDSRIERDEDGNQGGKSGGGTLERDRAPRDNGDDRSDSDSGKEEGKEHKKDLEKKEEEQKDNPENQEVPGQTEGLESEGIVPDVVEHLLGAQLAEGELNPDSEVAKQLENAVRFGLESFGPQAFKELIDGINKNLEGTGRKLEFSRDRDVEKQKGYDFSIKLDLKGPDGKPLGNGIHVNFGDPGIDV